MKENAIASVVTPVVEGLGLEVDRIETMRAGKRTLLRISLDGDGPQGRGPSLDEIAEATRAVSAALDASAASGNAPYTLEVSSRGVSRPLAEAKHYRRNIGRLVALTLAGGEKTTGRIVASSPDEVEIDIDGASRTVALSDISKAVVQVELNRPDEDAGDGDEEE
ncbi:ribosome maturation factor RimP [Nigerium sp.]|uniref:ribosome maturation factor RimP n=1 Tax=Nigerium sp. TaxID=2042655 RepID=UPI003221E1F9